MAVGALIVAAGITILWEAYIALRVPHAMEAPWSGMVVNALATFLNITWGGILIREGRRRRSAALAVDGKHLLTDVATSIGVLAGVAVVVVTGIEILDPAIAVVVALYILWSGWGVLARCMSSLLDEAAPVAELRRIRDVIAANTGDAIETHDLRTRRSGRTTYIELHLVVPGSMTVARSHEICDRLEAATPSRAQSSLSMLSLTTTRGRRRRDAHSDRVCVTGRPYDACATPPRPSGNFSGRCPQLSSGREAVRFSRRLSTSARN